jgi:hypothetical protein
MEKILRRSPVSFQSRATKTEIRDHWSVVLEYDAEGQGPHLIDLSHRARWDVQDRDLLQIQPWGVIIPDSPGQCTLQNGVLINRMNRTQASVWHLGGERLDIPAEAAYTDLTDATVFLALVGRDLFSITEKLTALDFLDPTQNVPFLLQGPFSHVPCQVVTLKREGERSGMLLTCARGYARDMVAAILEAGKEFELRPAGENAFSTWLKG